MKEHPILFSGPIVRAILEGRKTQTRRVIRPQPTNSGPGMFGDLWQLSVLLEKHCPYGQPGDTLWVRETWATFEHRRAYGLPSCETIREHGYKIYYRANWREQLADKQLADMDEKCFFDWRPSIHMPRWASRITLKVTAVRVERVKDITPNDCLAEGVLVDCPSCSGECWHWDQKNAARKLHQNARRDFAELWDSINAKRGYGWDKNPWCWAISFQRITPVGSASGFR